MATTISPNMGLIVPTVGVELGPQWATDLNASLSILDSHNHSAGQGVQVTPAGLNINSDLAFIGNNATGLRSVRFAPNGSPINGVSDLDCLSVSGVDLYYNDGAGNIIRMTQSGSVAGTSGSITGLVAPATATYVPGNQTFVFQSAALTPANIDVASIILRNLVASSKGLTLSPPNSMAADYTIVLPALPSVSSILLIDTSGNETTTPYNAVTTKTANYTATANDTTILVDASAGNVIVTLPSAATVPGRTYNIKKIDLLTTIVTINPQGGQTIDGDTTLVINGGLVSVTVVSNGGSAWYVI